MDKVVEIRWHGRGGQGAKTASLLLADAAFNTGKYIQGFPEYGPERMGAPITAYNRISDERLSIHSNIYEPDYVVVVDDTLLASVDVTAGLKENGAIIINTTKSPEEVKPFLKGYKGKVCTIDARTISIETLGKYFPNTPMLGAVVKVSKIMDEKVFLSVAVDPIDGTTLTAKGMANAVSVLAVSPRGSMFDPSAVFYMEKLVTGPEAADVVDIRYPVAENIAQVAKAKGSAAEDVTVVILDRPRHEDLVQEIRATGARIKFITDGDVAGAIMAARQDTGIDLLMGVGGTPEGIIAACAMKCMDGVIQARLWPTDDDERQRAIDAGHDLDPDTVLTTDDLVNGDDCFFVATGITDGELMKGVRYRAGGATTHSLVMRSRSGTIRSITSEHRLQKLRSYSAIDFEH